MFFRYKIIEPEVRKACGSELIDEYNFPEYIRSKIKERHTYFIALERGLSYIFDLTKNDRVNCDIATLYGEFIIELSEMTER